MGNCMVDGGGFNFGQLQMNARVGRIYLAIDVNKAPWECYTGL